MMDAGRVEPSGPLPFPQRSGHIPGEPGLWLLILGELVIFALFFLTYVYYHNQQPALFAASQRTLHSSLGAANTMLLLTSSWLVALAVHAARGDGGKATVRLLALAWLAGAGFATIKIVEYREKAAAGIGFTTNDFYMFYFMLTGIHLVHVAIGMAALAWIIARGRRQGFAPANLTALEGVASFWHLVDLLWIALFALLYLIP